MGMPSTSRDNLVQHLQAVGLAPRTDVVVHSRLISFGIIQSGVATVYDALRQLLGPEATIAVPTYRLAINMNRPADERPVFDVRETPSEAVGTFSEYVRQLPGAIRSACPVHSHAAIGPKANILRRVSGKVSFGPGSDFEQFYQHGFSVLYLGCSFEEAATYTFHVEAVFGAVPYREWVDLPYRVRRDDGSTGVIDVRYYRRTSLDAHEDLGVVERALRQAKAVTSAPCPFGKSHFVKLADFHHTILTLLRANPSALLRST